MEAKPSACSDRAREFMHQVFGAANLDELDAVAAEVKRLAEAGGASTCFFSILFLYVFYVMCHDVIESWS